MSFSHDLILLSTKICEDVDKLSTLNELNLTQLKKKLFRSTLLSSQ